MTINDLHRIPVIWLPTCSIHNLCVWTVSPHLVARKGRSYKRVSYLLFYTLEAMKSHWQKEGVREEGIPSFPPLPSTEWRLQKSPVNCMPHLWLPALGCQYHYISFHYKNIPKRAAIRGQTKQKPWNWLVLSESTIQSIEPCLCLVVELPVPFKVLREDYLWA